MMYSNEYPKLTVRASAGGPRPYHEHDDRKVYVNNQRGRSSRRNKGGTRFRGYSGGRDGNVRVDMDGDVSMASVDSGADQRNRFAPYLTGRKNYQTGGGRRIYVNDRDPVGVGPSRPHGQFNQDMSWKRVIIPYGRRMSKAFLLRSLTQATTVPFVPINFQYDGSSAVFYIEDPIAAAALAKLNRQLSTPEGHKMSIVIRPSQSPSVRLTDEVAAVLKDCVGRRFNAVTHSLDLSYFHQDSEFKNQGLHLPLKKPPIMTSVLSTVKENISDLIVLDLTGNNLETMDMIGSTLQSLSAIRILLLAQNKLTRLSEFDKIKTVPIEEVSLSGNPVCKAFRDHSDYVEAVRKCFPKLKKLDGVDLPPQIGFDIEKAVSLPASQGSFFVNEDSRRVVIQFLEQYFALYDSQDRQGLIDAYHDEAVFSMASHRVQKGTHSLQEYVSFSRNLLRVSDTDRRHKFLSQGKMAIVTFLQQLPKTQHDPSSFSVDVGLASASIISFSVCGIFKEVGSKSNSPPIRAFSRTFLLVPQGSGFCIVNETLLIVNATNEQVKVAFKAPAPTPSPSPVPAVTMPVSQTGNDDAVRQQMTATFAQQSRMNLEWAFKCLQDNGWDYDKAALIFTELNARGSIPPEAFQN